MTRRHLLRQMERVILPYLDLADEQELSGSVTVEVHRSKDGWSKIHAGISSSYRLEKEEERA